ncbi:MAG: hypothetical protein QOJ99_3044 [Bryobacterales bacterium]|jgi:hypothetical protein|nr:hypothetical protein [Bryobacterales bacterium]
MRGVDPEVHNMWQKLPGIVLVAVLSGRVLFAQAIETKARANDWEEINFEFNQAVIVDGFPGLLRLADQLKQHPDYKVVLTGNADQIGSNRYNQALSQRRAEAVSAFLQKYGAQANQITVQAQGKTSPEIPGRDRNARFINRRVSIVVTAPDGTPISDGTLNDAIYQFQQYARAQLGKIDGILTQLRDVETQVRALQGDTTAIRQATASLQQAATALQQEAGAIHTDTRELVGRPSPLTSEQTTTIARTEATRAADYALTQTALRNRKYALVGFDIGPTFANGSRFGNGKIGKFSSDVFAKALIPFGNGKTSDQPGTHGVQIDGDWVYFRKSEGRLDGLSDGILNVGLLNRFNRVQVGAFAQFDYVSLNAYQGGAMLGAGVLTIDIVGKRGMIGVFGGKGFRQYANVSTAPGTFAGRIPAYLRYDDQIGLHGITAVKERLTIEGGGAYMKRYLQGANKLPTGFLKLSFFPRDSVAVFVRADVNTTFQNFRSGDRVVFGIEFGNWLRPKQYGETQGVIPVSVPLPHYELLAR